MPQACVLLCVLLLCTFQEVVQHAILSRALPRAQAYLRKRNCAEQKLEELRKTGLRLAFTCLTHRDLQQATALLTNMVLKYLKLPHTV